MRQIVKRTKLGYIFAYILVFTTRFFYLQKSSDIVAAKSTRSLLSLLPCSQGEEKQVAKSLDPLHAPLLSYTISLLMLYDFLEHLGIFKAIN
jgi:hypothetical protein